MKIYVFYNTPPHPWQFDANWQFAVSIERLEVGEFCHLLKLGDVIAVGEQAAKVVERLCRRRPNAVVRDVKIGGGDVAVSVYYGTVAYKYLLKVDIAE